MINHKSHGEWEGVKLIRNKRGDVIGKKIYNFKTGKLLRTEKEYIPHIPTEGLFGTLRKRRSK